MKVKNQNSNTQLRMAVIKLGETRLKLMIKLFLYKTAIFPYIVIKNGSKSRSFNYIFEGKKNTFKALFGNSFINDCEAILEINKKIKLDNETFASHRKSLAKLLAIEDQYLVEYNQIYSAEPKYTLTDSETEAVFVEIAKTIVKFDVDADIHQQKTIRFRNTDYSIDPVTIIKFLNYPPLILDIDKSNQQQIENKDIKILLMFEAYFYSLIERNRSFIYAPGKDVVNWNEASKQHLSYLACHDYTKPKRDQIDSSEVISSPREKAQLPRFQIDSYIKFDPEFEVSPAITPEIELGVMLNIAKSEEKYKNYRDKVFTSEYMEKYGEVMLKAACYGANKVLVADFLSSNAPTTIDVSVNNKSALPALLCAAMGGSIPIFEMLIKAGASIAEAEFVGNNVYDICILARHYMMAAYLDKKYPYTQHLKDYEMDILKIAIATRNKEAINELVGRFKVSPQHVHLHLTLDMQQWYSFAFMLERTTELKREQASQLLIKCVRDNLVKEADQLLKSHPNLDLQLPSGHSLLSYATNFGYAKMASLLLSYHADPNDIDVTKIPIIARATYNGSYKIVSALLNAHAQTQTIIDGLTLIDIAIQEKHKKITKLYLEKKIFSPNTVLENNQTVFEKILQNFSDLELIQVCLAAKEPLLTTDNQSLLALALFLQCDIAIIKELKLAEGESNWQRLTYQKEDEQYSLQDLIKRHPQQKDLKALFATKASGINPWNDQLSSLPRYETDSSQNRDRVVNRTKPKLNLPKKSFSLFQPIAQMISEPKGCYFANNAPYQDIKDHLGLVIVDNDQRFALVTKQLDSLIDGYSIDRLVPFSSILQAPLISSKHGLKNIRDRKIEVMVEIDGARIVLDAPFELKARNQDRILVAELPSQDQGTILLLPVKWLKKGFHDARYDGIKLFNGGSIITAMPNSPKFR